MIQDGKYRARLFDATRFRTASGKEAVRFTWELNGSTERTSSVLTMTDSKGQKNFVGIQLIKKCFPKWDGQDLDWFCANKDACRENGIYVKMRDGAVDWVFPSDYWEAGRARTDAQASVVSNPTSTKPLQLVVDQAKRPVMPKDYEPSFAAAKAIFDAITEGSCREDAAKVWTDLAAQIGPMQIDFTPDQWRRMIDEIQSLSKK